MSWWPFGSGGDTSAAKTEVSSLPKSEYDELVPPPPSGGAVPPPSPPPKSVGSSAASATEPFKGFSLPPPTAPATASSSSSLSPSSSASSSASGSLFSLPSIGVGKGEDYYANEDFSKYTSPYSPESPGFYDRQYAEEERRRADRLHSGREALLDRYITNPRLRGCLEGVKMGVKMGAAVGGIFGLLTGGYAAFAHRNFLILPVSMIGGAVSFGFFLGCGMIIRCEDGQAFCSPPSSSPFSPPLHVTKNITESLYLSTAAKSTIPSSIVLAGRQRRCVALPAYRRHW